MAPHGLHKIAVGRQGQNVLPRARPTAARAGDAHRQVSVHKRKCRCASRPRHGWTRRPENWAGTPDHGRRLPRPDQRARGRVQPWPPSVRRSASAGPAGSRHGPRVGPAAAPPPGQAHPSGSAAPLPQRLAARHPIRRPAPAGPEDKLPAGRQQRQVTAQGPSTVPGGHATHADIHVRPDPARSAHGLSESPARPESPAPHPPTGPSAAEPPALKSDLHRSPPEPGPTVPGQRRQVASVQPSGQARHAAHAGARAPDRCEHARAHGACRWISRSSFPHRSDHSDRSAWASGKRCLRS